MQIAYHLRQKSPLHFATSHNTLQQSQLNTWQITAHFVRKHTILGPGLSIMAELLF